MEEKNQTWILWIILIIFLVWFLMDYFRKRNSYEGLDFAAGTTCTANTQCASEACGYYDPHKEERHCCSTNKMTQFMFKDWCTDLPSGNGCWTDAMCASSKCNFKGVPGIEGPGTCQ